MIFELRWLKETDIFAEVICKGFNESLGKSKFPGYLKLTNVTPKRCTYLKKIIIDPQKNNYRPVSILPTLSKPFEQLISKQLLNFFESILSKFQCGFRKDSQNCLLMTLET